MEYRTLCSGVSVAVILILGGVETKMNPVTRRAEMSKCAHHLPSLVNRSLDLEIHGRCFSAALFDLILDVLAFIERVQSRALDCGDVNEHVFAATLRLNESIALIRIEPFHRAARHCRSPVDDAHILFWICSLPAKTAF